MIIDHINTIWLHQSVMLMELVGRGTFPLFCYAMAVAVLKVKDGPLPHDKKKKAIRRYLLRLFILAVVSQPFYFFAVGDNNVNVIFTLAVGVVFAALSFRVKLWQMYALYVLALVSMLWDLPVEFGLAGMMLPSAIMLVQRGNKSAWLFLILLLFFINAGGFLGGLRAHAGAAVWAYVALNGLCAIILPWLVVDMARRLPQPSRSDSDKNSDAGTASGRFLPKYALYVFYPAHLAILKLLGMAFFK